MDTRFTHAAYGGPGWRPRAATLGAEIGTRWRACGQRSEWHRLLAVLLHRPGGELAAIDADVDANLMLARPDVVRAAAQHDALAETFRRLGVTVHYVDPPIQPPPNQMFVADLLFMTGEGAIVGRPASAVRAGEERWIAARLAALGVPILRTVCGSGTFEGADAMWLDSETVIIGVGLRTNREGARQVAGTLADIGVRAIQVDLPYGTMHLMGQLRIADRDLAFVWPGRISMCAVAALRERGYEVRHFPDEAEARSGFAHNFVTVGPREIAMPGGNPVSERGYREAGITCHVVEVDEIAKAAGSVGCLTGVLQREAKAVG